MPHKHLCPSLGVQHGSHTQIRYPNLNCLRLHSKKRSRGNSFCAEKNCELAKLEGLFHQHSPPSEAGLSQGYIPPVCFPLGYNPTFRRSQSVLWSLYSAIATRRHCQPLNRVLILFSGFKKGISISIVNWQICIFSLFGI